MTVQEFEEKQRLYNELQDAKKQYEESKELMEYVNDLTNRDKFSLFNVYKSFETAIIHIGNSNACCTTDTWKEVFNMLTNLAKMAYLSEEKRYNQLLSDFEK